MFPAFARSIGSISNVFALLAFFMVIFSILGIELMSGTLRGYCYFDPRPGRNNFTPAALSRLLSQQTPFLAEQYNILGAWNVYVQTCRPDEETAFGVPSGFTCTPMAIDGVFYNATCSTKKWCFSDWCVDTWNSNPWDDGAGYLSYDNICSALMTNFQCLTLAAWDDVLYRISNGGNLWLSRLYHTAWIFLGAFVVVQLALAVLADAFVQVSALLFMPACPGQSGSQFYPNFNLWELILLNRRKKSKELREQGRRYIANQCYRFGRQVA